MATPTLGEFVRQCKGTDYNKLLNSKRAIPDNNELVQTKLKKNGRYTQVHIRANTVRLFTSSGKRFRHTAFESDLLHMADKLDKGNNGDSLYGIYEAEFTGITKGMLGDLGASAKQNSYRASYDKGEVSKIQEGDHFYIFHKLPSACTGDGLEGGGNSLQARNTQLEALRLKHKTSYPTFSILPMQELTHGEAVAKAKRLIEAGHEGLVCTRKTAYYKNDTRKPRIKGMYKLKAAGSVTLECIDTIEGKGKYQGMVGSLVLDTAETVVSLTIAVGSGLTDAQRLEVPSFFIGKFVTIKYFSMKNSYQQPIVVSVV